MQNGLSWKLKTILYIRLHCTQLNVNVKFTERLVKPAIIDSCLSDAVHIPKYNIGFIKVNTKVETEHKIWPRFEIARIMLLQVAYTSPLGNI